MVRCAVLGATGIIGQQFCRILADHPHFELTNVFASERSAGKLMKDIWGLPFFDCPEVIRNMQLEDMTSIDTNIEVIFSGLPSSIAKQIEHDLRAKGVKVFSNASAYRMDKNVPILVPEINADHFQLIELQQDTYNSDGYIITNSNCSAAGSAIYLYELANRVEIDTAIITTYQALSGAGIRGVAALQISSNVIPYIGNEEPKIIEETQKMVGRFVDNQVQPADFRVIANAARVDVIDGHLQAISVTTTEDITEDSIASLQSIQSPLDLSKHYIAPATHLHYLTDPDRPQPSLDVLRSAKLSTRGMVVHFGRIRYNPRDISAYILVHNTIRGGAGGSVLNAEYAKSLGKL